MLRIHFQPRDLSRVQVMTTLGPIAEAVFALNLIGTARSPLFDAWQQRLPAQLGSQMGAVNQLVNAHRPVPDLLWLLQPAVSGVPAAEQPGRRQVSATVGQFAQKAIAPYWRRVLTFLDAEREARGRVLLSGGLERMLGTLHPGIQWRAGMLEIASDEDMDADLGGRGLLLVPSVFLFKRPAVLLSRGVRGQRPVLAFSAPPDIEAAATLFDSPRGPGEALPALIGRTRARLLHYTRISRTTSQLAKQLGISAAAVSQHTGVLRRAGLISTRRNRNTVEHTITSLGVALLGGVNRSVSPLALTATDVSA